VAETPSIEVSQAFVSSINGGDTLSVQISQAFVAAVANFPTEQIQVSQGFVTLLSGGTDRAIEVSQAMVLVICRGRVDDPKIRAWTFTLDGHDFYVLRLGNTETLVYDLTTEQWSVWGAAEENLWSAYTGINWIGGNGFAAQFGSNIIVGADSNGSIFFLDPDKPNDDAVVTGRGPSPFRRRLTGQIPLRGYNYTRVFEVQLLGSVSDLDNGATEDIELLYSDDRGDNYVSAGTIATIDGQYDIRASWRSLGSFSSPGRLFRFQDFGALKRVDSITINTNLEG
jgi:hypothetical protein